MSNDRKEVLDVYCPESIFCSGNGLFYAFFLFFNIFNYFSSKGLEIAKNLYFIYKRLFINNIQKENKGFTLFLTLCILLFIILIFPMKIRRTELLSVKKIIF